MFTARNRQNPFAKRRQAQAEAEAAISAPESSPEPPAPKPVQMATGGIIDPPKTALVEPTADAAREAADELSRLGQEIEFLPNTGATARGPVVVPISAETQAKIDEIVNRAVSTVDDGEDDDFDDEALTLDTLIETMPMEQGPAPIAEPETPPEAEPKRGRGRPRPQETIVRDNAVHTLLLGADPETGISKESIAAELNEKEQQVYSSLRQLKKEGRADTRYVKDHGWRWFPASPAETA